MPAHVHDTFRFEQLDNAGQARSINAMTNNLGNAMAHRVRHAGSPTERERIRDLHLAQLRRAILRLSRV